MAAAEQQQGTQQQCPGSSVLWVAKQSALREIDLASETTRLCELGSACVLGCDCYETVTGEQFGTLQQEDKTAISTWRCSCHQCFSGHALHKFCFVTGPYLDQTATLVRSSLKQPWGLELARALKPSHSI
jgi:hypothetical protein